MGLSDLILAAGILLAAALAVAELRPAWRLPALALGLLAVPGNVDNFMPAMHLDYHAIANNTAPAISVVDLLIAWAVVLTVRERRGDQSQGIRPFLVGASVLAGIGVTVSAIAVVRGVEPAAALRGGLLVLRLVALLFLASRLREETREGALVAVGISGGAIVLLGNGVYTTITQHQDRFTATTFGRNDFADVLMATSIVATGLALQAWPAFRTSRMARAQTLLCAAIAAMAVFAATATGTRMALAALAAGGVTAGMLSAFWRSRTELLRATVIAAAFVALIGAAAVMTTSGTRTVSLITNPAGGITNPSRGTPTQPGDSEVKSRLEFWSMALKMVAQEPITGVGPFQWNIHRYDISPKPVVVADAHSAYLQMGAEFGVPALLAFLALLGLAFWRLILVPFVPVLPRRSHKIPATAVGFTAAALVLAVADLVNSNFFNVRTGAFEWLLIAVSLTITLRVLPPGWLPTRGSERE